MPPKTILVTGGTGFIGLNLLRGLRSKPDVFTPIALSRRSSTVLETILDYPCGHDTVFIADFTAPFSLPITPSIVVHLAADMDFFPAKRLDQNVTITRNLLDACVRTGHRSRFVYVSTAEVVGPATGSDEDALCKPSNEYGRSKLAAEALVKTFADRLDVVIARPTGVYGPGERFFFYEFMNMVASGIAIVAPSPLSGRVVFVHISDVVDALIALSTNADAVGGTYNICADEPVSFRQIVETISDCLALPHPKIFLNTAAGVWLMRCIAPIMNIGRKRVFVYHPKTVRESVQDRVYSNRRLRKLGVRPKYTVLAGVEQTVKYEIEHGGLARGPLPAAFARGLHLISVVVFAVTRWAFRRRDAQR